MRSTIFYSVLVYFHAALEDTAFHYISHEALGVGVIFRWTLALLLLSWEVTALSRCLSDRGELHGGYGCGFKRDKSQRGEWTRTGSRHQKKRKNLHSRRDTSPLESGRCVRSPHWQQESVALRVSTAGILFFLLNFGALFLCLPCSDALPKELSDSLKVSQNTSVQLLDCH